MKTLGLFAIAALFSATAVAQSHQDERDLENRTAPTYNTTKTKTETKTSSISKGDADYRDHSAMTSDLNTSKKNSLCCGKEKDDGFLGEWKLNIMKNDHNRDAIARDASSRTSTKTKTTTKTETDMNMNMNKSDMRNDVGVSGSVNDEDKDLNRGVTTGSEIDLNTDDRMDAGSRSNLDLDVNTDNDAGVRTSTGTCPTNDSDHMDHEMNDNSPR
jgi:hypothetical protein